MSILGANFTGTTTVRLVGYGFLTTTYVNEGALTAALPNTIAGGEYEIEISDAANGTDESPDTLTVNAPEEADATATATSTPLPGQPELVVQNFSASPSTINPGGVTQITFTVANVGSRTAEGVVVALGEGEFTPANGQASVMLPDLDSYEGATVTLSVAAPMDAAEGPHNIPLVLTSRDFSGSVYNDTAAASVQVAAQPVTESQVILGSYQVTPSSALPGDTVTVQALFRNTGTETATQVLVQLDAASRILIAGAQGNALSIGDMPAGSSAPITMSLW